MKHFASRVLDNIKDKCFCWTGGVFSYLFIAVLRILIPFLRILPPKAWSRIAGIVTPFVWIGLKRRRKQALYNLQNVLGLSLEEAKVLGKASFHSNILVLFESLTLKRLLDQKGVDVEVEMSSQAAKILEDLKNGEIKMALALSAHSGVWECIGAYLARLVHPIPTAVSSKLPRNTVVSSFLRRIRANYGLILVNKNHFVKYILKRKIQNSPSLNIFLCDQHFNKPGAIKVPFLGKSACTVSVPAALIYKHKIPTITGHCIRKKPGSYRIEISALDLEEFENLSNDQAQMAITIRINEVLSSYILEAPEQWMWGHRRWRDCCDL